MANNFDKKYSGRNNKYKSEIFCEKAKTSRNSFISYEKIGENYYEMFEEGIKEICEKEHE